MAIPAIRFKPFNEETNIAIANFEDIQTNDIFNSPNAALQEVTEGLQELLDQNTPDLGKLEELKDDLVRATTDIFSTVKDISGMVPKEIEKTISDMLPDNPVVQNMFKQLSMECKKNSLGKRHNTRAFKDRSGCNSGNGKCDKGQVSGLLGKLTGGAIGGVAGALNGALNALISLGNLGYDVGICKVFQALAGNLPNNILGRGGAILMGQLAGKGNTSGIIDIAGQMSGLSPLLEFPGAISKAVESFNTKGLGLVGAAGLANFTDRFMGGMEIMKDGWTKSESGLNSIANMGDKFNPDWYKAISDKPFEFELSDDYLDSLEDVTDNDYAELSAAYGSMDDFDSMSDLINSDDSDIFAGLGGPIYGDLEDIDATGMFDELS